MGCRDVALITEALSSVPAGVRSRVLVVLQMCGPDAACGVLLGMLRVPWTMEGGDGPGGWSWTLEIDRADGSEAWGSWTSDSIPEVVYEAFGGYLAMGFDLVFNEEPLQT